ncbi:hypothetical protein [Arthrobacter sp. Br18]|uniref:hypothetical protein n=1 Tax=Arthrobacter sp. Br18 TaxID=1312954 RepID=UPI00047E8093|nr:hypothetical protein [Arthrobacter sp. Br18]
MRTASRQPTLAIRSPADDHLHHQQQHPKGTTITDENLHLLTDDYFRFNRFALALFRATSLDDTDALAVLEAQAAAMPVEELEQVERLTGTMFAMAAQMPASIGPERILDEYGARLDQLEAAAKAAREK